MIAVTAIMTALAIVGNYTVVFLPNVELGSIVLFVTAYVFGPIMALWSTLIMSIIFGTLNPWGGFIPQIWASQVIGWVYVVLAGAIAGKPGRSGYRDSFSSAELGLIGLVVTVVFDLVTNIGYSLTFAVPYVVALIAGLPFLAIHVVSNVILFASVVPQLNRIIREQFYSVLVETENLDLVIEGEE
jgi:hypothetical protein